MKPKTVGRSSGQVPATAQPICAGIGPGSILLTQAGETPVEDLRPGDRVITRDTGLATVREITKHRITTHAIRILAGSLGDTRPDRDVVVPAGQNILVRDWRAEAMFGQAQALVPAAALVDGEFITNEGMQTLTVFALHFDAAHVLYVDGLEMASGTDAAARSSAA